MCSVPLNVTTAGSYGSSGILLRCVTGMTVTTRGGRDDVNILDEEQGPSDRARAWEHEATMMIHGSSGARPAALEAEIACSFCPGLNGEHVKNCIRPGQSDD